MKKLLLCLPLLCPFVSKADKITIDGGSVIQGTITKIHQEKMYIKTDFSAEIIIDLKKVQSFNTDSAQTIETTDGQRLNGKVNFDRQLLSVENGQSNTKSQKTAVKMLWAPGTQAPDYIAPPVREWKSSAALDLNISEGNTQEKNFALQADTYLKGENDKLLFYLKFRRTEKEGVKNAEEYIGGADYEYDFTQHSSWYIRTELENDEFEGIDLRTTAAAGYGYYFIKEPKQQLRGRIGALMRHESYEENDNDSTVGVDTGLRFDWQINNNTKWYTDITYSPSLEDLADFRLNHESALAYDMADAAWKLKLGVNHKFNSEPADDTQELDTIYFSRIEYSW